MAESSETVEQLERRLAELRAMFGRIERGCLQPGDRSLLIGLISELIEEAENNGQDWASLELSEAEQAWLRKHAGAEVLEDSTSGKPRS